jgi:FAD/FMN-containing dehydrogenase
MTTPSTAISDMSPSLAAILLRPEDPAYEEARRVHNGLIDKRPRLIARCRGTADVIEAVTFARQHRIDVAMRGGGHNVAGRATIDDGLMIDLSPMKGIHVDPRARTARAQPGLTWGGFNRETQVHGLATTGGVVSSTGIAGLTLGGGLGWLMAKHGLAIDNLLSAELVTADGRVLTASAEENPDLFWAVRGGGGNFGVATSFEYRLHPVGPRVTGGLIAHPFPAARDLFRMYRDVTPKISDELVLFAALVHGPDGSKLAAIAACHCGSPQDASAALAPIRAFGSPVLDTLGEIPYTAVNAMLDAGFPKGALNYWKSNFLSELSDAGIDAMIEQFARCSSPMSQMVLEHFHGAATRVGVSDTAFPHRREGYNFLTASQWMDPSYTQPGIAWARESYAAMQPFFAEGRYVNYLGFDEGDDPAAAAYGPSYERLRRIKSKYDPENFFRQNQNIRPA